MCSSSESVYIAVEAMLGTDLFMKDFADFPHFDVVQ